ncbi:retrovirus-related pol polyprotein from transposon TNT 1-94 [Tanacetum coccineum]
MMPCVSRYLNDVNARTKKPKVVPISASKPKRKANKSVATPHKKTVASDTTIQKSKSYYKELYENTNQEWKWWIAKKCPSGYKWTQKPHRTKKIWMPKIRKEDVSTSISPTIDIVSRITNIVQLILFIVDSGCTKHMTGNLKLLCNFVEKFLGTVHFGNDQFALILGYGDLNQGNVMIKWVYYVECLKHNLFLVGQFCDADLEEETPEVLKDFLMMIQHNLQAQVITVRTDRGTEFLNKTLHVYFKEEGIEHQTSILELLNRTAVGERRNPVHWLRTKKDEAQRNSQQSRIVLNGYAQARRSTEGGVYVAQQKGFVIQIIRKVTFEKALYGLKQAPRAWYDELSNFLMSKGFTKAFSDADHGRCMVLGKATSGGYSSLVSSSKLGCQYEQKLHCNVLQQQVEYVALSASCCSSNVYEDTASKILALTTTNTVVLRLSVSIEYHATPYNLREQSTSILDILS